jgi:hypothetical protein
MPYWLAADDTSSAREVALATNATGDAIAAWTQPHRGRNAVFASIRSGGTWGSPELVATDAEKAVVSASASAFLVAYVDYSAGPARAAGRVRSGGTWGAAYRFWNYSTLNMTAATDGSSFAVAFLDLNGAAWSPITAFWTGGVWTVQSVATGSSIDTPVRVAGVPGEFRYVWKYFTGSTGTPAYRYQVKTRRAVVAAGAWTLEPEAVPDDYGKNSRYEPVIAAGPDGFMLAWEQSSFPQQVRGALCTGATCGASARVDAGANCTTPGVTSGLGGFVAVYPCSGSVRANLWASGAWGVDGATGSTSWVFPAALAGSDTAVRMALLVPGAGNPPAYSIQVREWSGAGAWTAPFDVETVTLDITDPIGNAWAAGE